MANGKPLLTLEEIEALVGPRGPIGEAAESGLIRLPQPDTAKVLDLLRPHEHIAALYDSISEGERLVRQFLLAGLRRGQVCVAILSGELLERVRRVFEPAVRAADRGELPGSLTVLAEDELSGKERIWYGRLRDLIVSEGSAEFRLVREPLGPGEQGGDLETYLRGEARFDAELCARHACVSMGLYSRRLAPSLLKAALSIHPLAAVESRIIRNVCAVAPAAYMRPEATDIEIRRLIRRMVEGSLRVAREEFLDRVLGELPQPFLALWPDGRLMTCNRSLLDLTGQSLAEAQLLTLPDDLLAPGSRDSGATAMAELLRTCRAQRLDVEVLRAGGDTVSVHLLLGLMEDPVGRPEWIYGFMLQEVGPAAVKESGRPIREEGGPHSGRPVFLERIGMALSRVKRRDEHRFTVMLLELNGSIGESPLQCRLGAARIVGPMSRRLDKSLRTLDVPLRIAADSFGILLEEVSDARDAIRIARRVQEEVCRPFRIEGCDVTTNCAIGIVMGGVEYDSPEQVIRDAETALSRTRLRGGRRIELFDSLQHDLAMKFLHLESDLARAVSCGEMLVHYQPIISLADGSIAGFEALPRWLHPDRGLLSPEEFIPVAEATGLIHALEPWVLREACGRLKLWQERGGGGRPVFVSVNISRRNLLRLGFIHTLDGIISETGVHPSGLKLEVTEAAIADKPDMAKATADALASREIELFMDDFGCGPASLTLLHSLPLDAIKIDGSCIRIPGMASSIVQIARKLDIPVISEGVETEDLLDQARRLDCPLAQGFLLGRPLGADEAGALLAQVPG